MATTSLIRWIAKRSRTIFCVILGAVWLGSLFWSVVLEGSGTWSSIHQGIVVIEDYSPSGPYLLPHFKRLTIRRTSFYPQLWPTFCERDIGYTTYAVPLWLILLFVGWRTVWRWVSEPVRRRNRRRRGLCVVCGFDLAHSPTGVCPDCGPNVERNMVHEAVIVALTLWAASAGVLAIGTARTPWRCTLSVKDQRWLICNMFDGRTSLFWISSPVPKPEALLDVRQNVYIKRGVGLITLGGAGWKVAGGPYQESAFGAGSKTYTHPSWPGSIVVRFVQAPSPLPFLLFAAYPTIAFIRGPVRRWRRLKGNRCVHCGYNLTGLSEPRCPECGEPIRSMACAE